MASLPGKVVVSPGALSWQGKMLMFRLPIPSQAHGARGGDDT